MYNMKILMLDITKGVERADLICGHIGEEDTIMTATVTVNNNFFYV